MQLFLSIVWIFKQMKQPNEHSMSNNANQSLKSRAGNLHFTHVALYKRASMSKLLTSLYKRAMWENRSCCSLKKSMWVIRSWFEQIGIKNHSKNLYFSCVYDSFSTFYVEGESLPLLFNHLLFFKERLERFAPVALYEQVIVSNLLRLFMTKEWQEQFALFHAQIVLSLTKNKWIAQKTYDLISNPVKSWPKPGSALELLYAYLFP